MGKKEVMPMANSQSGLPLQSALCSCPIHWARPDKSGKKSKCSCPIHWASLINQAKNQNVVAQFIGQMSLINQATTEIKETGFAISADSPRGKGKSPGPGHNPSTMDKS
jgi:hypothetical protein